MQLAAACGNVTRPPRGDGAAVAGHDCVVAQPPAQLGGDDLRLHRNVAPRGARIHQRAPLLHPSLGLFEKRAIALAGQERQEGRQRPPAVADEADVHRIAEADPHRVQLDLHAARLAGFRVVLDVRKGGADDEQRVAGFQRLLRRARAEQPDGARRVGAVVRHHAFTEQRLDDRRRQQIGHALELVPGAQRSAPGEDRHLAAGVQELGGASQILVGRQPRAARRDVGGVVRNVALGAQLVGLHLLHVHRDRDVRDPVVGQRRATGEVDDVLDVRGTHDARVVLADVYEEAVELDVLLRVGADQVVIGQSGDREHGLAVELGVVEAVQQMDAAGTRCRQAHAEASGELRVAARHERRGFLVTYLHEADAILARAQRLHDPVDAVAGQAEDDLHVPVQQGLDQYVRRRLSHGVLPASSPEWPLHRGCQ